MTVPCRPGKRRPDMRSPRNCAKAAIPAACWSRHRSAPPRVFPAAILFRCDPGGRAERNAACPARRLPAARAAAASTRLPGGPSVHGHDPCGRPGPSPSHSPARVAASPKRAALQHENSAAQCRPMRERRPTAFRLWPLRRQQRLNQGPQLIGRDGPGHAAPRSPLALPFQVLSGALSADATGRATSPATAMRYRSRYPRDNRYRPVRRAHRRGPGCANRAG
jgi:hypothetical protein